MKKRVGIITLCDNNNYGNKLQNYALLKKIEEKDFLVNSIWVSTNWITSNSFFDKLKSYLRFIKLLIKSLVSKRKRIFLKFNKYLNYDNIKIITKRHQNLTNKKYDYLIVGSDQVWNYNYVRNFETYLLLNNEKNKNISYAASFGVSDVDSELKETYKKGLLNFKAISVREDRGKEIVEELTNRKDVEVVVDPTMLLRADEWDKIAKKPKQLKTDKYILNYFLGELSESRKKEIDRIAQENGCEVINLIDKNSPFYATGPSEFLYLEKNAFLICTDSFHSCVFAILYNRPFVIFDREGKAKKMNSRIDTLINKFNLKNRKFEGCITEKNIKHDYTEAYEILEKEREKADRFLRNSLNITEI